MEIILIELKSGNTILIYRERWSIQILIVVPIKSLAYLPNNVKNKNNTNKIFRLLILNRLTLFAISKSSSVDIIRLIQFFIYG